MKFAWRLFIINLAWTWHPRLCRPRWTATGSTLNQTLPLMVQYFSLAKVPTDLCQTSWKLKTMGLQVHPVIQQRILSLWMPADCHPIWTTCQLYYVPGDILYGWVGRAASIRRWLLLYDADKVQKREELMTPRIKIGMDLWDRPSLTSRFCSTVVIKIRSLNLHATSGCRRCYLRY